MHHNKTDSEVTSISASSPARSPRRPVYYVQSPSRDSHDGEKTATSFHSTPIISPMGSPPHSHSSIGHHSRDSSSTRFSGSLKPPHGSSRKVLPNDREDGGKGGRGGRKKPWKECEAIEEEGLLEDEDERDGLPRKCYYLAFLLGFVVLFSFFSLVLWGASKNQKPRISMKTISFDNFIIQAGTDATGVATDMVSLNSTVKLTFRNTANFFGLHVSAAPLDLYYSQLNLASGEMKYFYQRRKSQRNVQVVVLGNKVPLYGGGSTLSNGPASTSSKQPVPLTLGFTVRSRAYVLGNLVKPKFLTRVQCSVVMDPNKLNVATNLRNCTYS